MQMEMSTKESGKMTKLMDSESTITLMEQSMKDTGEKISNMVMVKRHGPMVLAMKESTKMERRTVLDSFPC